MNLTEGLLRVHYRDSWERPTLMMPGEVYAITIALFPVANRAEDQVEAIKGHLAELTAALRADETGSGRAL